MKDFARKSTVCVRVCVFMCVCLCVRAQLHNEFEKGSNMGVKKSNRHFVFQCL